MGIGAKHGRISEYPTAEGPLTEDSRVPERPLNRVPTGAVHLSKPI